MIRFIRTIKEPEAYSITDVNGDIRDVWDIYKDGKQMFKDLEWFECTLLQEMLDKLGIEWKEV